MCVISTLMWRFAKDKTTWTRDRPWLPGAGVGRAIGDDGTALRPAVVGVTHLHPLIQKAFGCETGNFSTWKL